MLETAGVGSGELVGVGAFAQLSGLTVETLRHYHQVGLLEPVEVDDRTGYRRYGLGQLARARSLAALRDVGMPLEDVAAIVDTTDRGVRRAKLVEHRRRLSDAARQAAGRVDAMDRMIEKEDVMGSPLRTGEGTPMSLRREVGEGTAGHARPNGLRPPWCPPRGQSA